MTKIRCGIIRKEATGEILKVDSLPAVREDHIERGAILGSRVTCKCDCHGTVADYDAGEVEIAYGEKHTYRIEFDPDTVMAQYPHLEAMVTLNRGTHGNDYLKISTKAKDPFKGKLPSEPSTIIISKNKKTVYYGDKRKEEVSFPLHAA